MQHGSLTTKSRLEGPDVWQFRWSEKGSNGKRIYRKRVIGTIKEFPNQDAARNTVASLITEVDWANLRSTSITMTVAQLCSHFEQRELARSNTWRSYSTKMCYAVYLRRWVDLRHAVDCLRCGRPMQDGILAETGSGSSPHRRNSSQVERTANWLPRSGTRACNRKRDARDVPKRSQDTTSQVFRFAVARS